MKKRRILSFVMGCALAVSCTTSVFAADATTAIETNLTDVVIDNYNESIDMTDQQALEYFEEFLTLQNISMDSEDIDQDVLEEFAQYAVDTGIIDDTVEQQGTITKAVVRAEFSVVVAGGNLAGYTTAATFLNHSLQDSPTDLSYSSSSTYASQILNSSECKTIISDFKSYVAGKSLSKRVTSGSTTLNSTTDLHLAYNNVSYVATGTKSNGTWTLTIVFSDTYDFESQAWKNAMTDSAAVTALNNYAAYAQSIGAIVPYDIEVTVQTTFTE